MVSEGAREASRVRLPGGAAVVGAARVGATTLAVWTTSGDVYAIAPDRTIRRAAHGVCLAFGPSDGTSDLVTVHLREGAVEVRRDLEEAP